MIKLVAFDWNGTILADTNAVVVAESDVLQKYGRPRTNLKEFQATYSIPFRIYWIKMGIDPKIFDRDVLKIRKLFFHYYEPLEKRCRTRSGARQILTWLNSDEISVIVFSNHPAQHIKNQLSHLKLIKYFQTILGSSAVEDTAIMHKRGKEAQLIGYVKHIGLKPKEVLVVGDTDEEIDVCKKYGFVSVALTGGNLSIKRLKAAKPDYLIHNLTDLKGIVKKLNK